MIDYSLNEVASRAKLAAKGAGYSWGMAEEVSSAVFWLSQHDLPSSEALLVLLKAFENPAYVTQAMPAMRSKEFRSRGDFLCPIAAGCLWSDSINSTNVSDVSDVTDERAHVSMINVVSPILLLPFIAQSAASSSTVVALEYNGEKMVTDGQHISISSKAMCRVVRAENVVCRVASEREAKFAERDMRNTKTRAVVDAGVWESLSLFAHRTYAPATESSRALGAGAGLNDND